MIIVPIKYNYEDEIRRCEVELNVSSFEDICEDNMSFRSSDKLIKDALMTKYKLKRKFIKDIRVISDEEMNGWYRLKQEEKVFNNGWGR